MTFFITAQTAFHHCTFQVITAHVVHHCTLKQALAIVLNKAQNMQEFQQIFCRILPVRGFPTTLKRLSSYFLDLYIYIYTPVSKIVFARESYSNRNRSLVVNSRFLQRF